MKAIAPSTKEQLNHKIRIVIDIKKFVKMLLKKVIITKANTTCPTVILATNRTASVIGRRNNLKSSIIDNTGDSTKATPFGMRFLKKLLQLNKRLESKQELHLTKARGKIIISCVVREIPIGMRPKMLVENNRTNNIVKMKEVFLIFSCVLKILKML